MKYFDAFLNLIPLSFVLGFYVSYVASRWWQQFLAIPWPDKLFHSIACYIEGFDDDSRMLRRSLMRWMNLALILVLRSISSAVKQRFPTLDHVVEAGFMTVNEKKLFESVPANEFNTYWVPCTWFVYRLQEATKHGRLLNQYALENIMRVRSFLVFEKVEDDPYRGEDGDHEEGDTYCLVGHSGQAQPAMEECRRLLLTFSS